MTAADAILVPTQANNLAVQGLELTFQTALQTQRQFNPSLRILGILLTMVDARTKHSRLMVSLVRRSFEGKVRVFETTIGLQVGFKESSKDGVSILRYSTAGPDAIAYRALAREVVTAAEALARDRGGSSANNRSELADVAQISLRRTESLTPAVGASVANSPAAPSSAVPSVADRSESRPVPIAGSRLPSSTAADAVPESGVGKAQEIWGPYICPFLGLVEDKARQLDRPDEAHRCWADGTPFAVGLEWQRTTCRQRFFWACLRYGPNVYRTDTLVLVCGAK